MTSCIAEEARSAKGRAEARRLAAAENAQQNAYTMQPRTVTCHTFGNTTTCN